MDLISQIDRLKKHETPFYAYSLNDLNRNLDSCKKAASKYNYQVHFAVKANSNPKILHEIKNAGFGADCVSGGEVKASIESGFAANDVVFAGVGKADWEIELGLKENIFCFNVESVQEIEIINELAIKHQKIAQIALRLNPNVDPKTHAYITTGLEENKFGINPWEYDLVIEKLNQCNNVKPIGLHFHIGSQITDLNVFKELCLRVNEIQNHFKDKNLVFSDLNLGGGLGIDYHNPDENPIPPYDEYFDLFHQFLTPMPNQKIHFELGRALVGYCGNLISKVLYIKEGIKTNFAILDAGMTELIRPALYNAYHKIENISNHLGEEKVKYDVVGPICESSDTFGKSIELPKTQRGDYISIRSAGAYGEVIVSNYNLRNFPKSIFID